MRSTLRFMRAGRDSPARRGLSRHGGCAASCRMAAMPSELARKLEIVTDVPASAMVVFAHPDDAEIGAGGVVARWVAAGCEVTYVLCTNGDSGTADRALTPVELARRR